MRSVIYLSSAEYYHSYILGYNLSYLLRYYIIVT